MLTLTSMIRFRRWFLKTIVPEIYWPEFVQVDNVSFKVRGTPYSFGIKKLLSRSPEKYEFPERLLCKRAIRKGDDVLEMGGSIGVLARIISELTGDEGRVISIEADDKLAEYSAMINQVNNSLKIVQGYAFPIYDEVKFQVLFDNTSGGSLGGRVSYSEDRVNYSDNLFSIKKIEQLFEFRPNVLVVDIEGAESVMCSYKPNFPLYLKTIIIELHPHLYGFDELMRIVEVIKSEGYTLEIALGQVYLFERGQQGEGSKAK